MKTNQVNIKETYKLSFSVIKKLLTLICMSIAMDYATASVNIPDTNNKHSSQLFLIIKSELPFDLKNARVKVDAGDV